LRSFRQTSGTRQGCPNLFQRGTNLFMW